LEVSISPEDMAEQAKEVFKKVFPHSFINASVGKLGEPSVLLKIALGTDKSEFSNGIIQNDPMHTVIMIDGWNRDGSTRDKFTVENNSNSGLTVKASPENKMYAFERIKIWRKFSGDKAKVLSGLEKYFVKVKEAIKENLDRLPEYAKDKI
jgi:hypothetical protein